MKKTILQIIQACVFIAFLLASESVFAEGSATLYPSGATGKRASLNARSRTVPRLFDIFPTPGTMKVYVKAGETLYVGSSAQGISQTYGTPFVTYTGKINLRAPNGSTYSSGTSTTVGLIANRTEELAGPDRTGVTTGYTPFTRVVQSAEEGIWEVDFVPPTNPDTTSVPQYNIDANASWVQQKRAMIVAWDVSVGSASNPATLIPGRVFTNNFNGNLAASSTVLTSERLNITLYLLTDAGYKFRVKTNGFNGKSFNFFVNNKGVQNTSSGSSVTTTPLSWKDGTASYSSKAFTQTDLDNNVNSYLYDPREPDNSSSGNPDITHKIFYNTPATDLPTSAPIRYNGGASTTTWLVPSTYPSSPTISNLSVVGVESGTTGLVGPDGAYIRFNSNVPGTYTITLTFSTGTARTLTGNCVAGLNQIFWDGKNGSGATVSSGVTVTAQNTIRSGEMHFPFEDVEINPNGIIIELLQSNNSLFSPNQDIVYWNDTGLSGGTSSSPLDNSTTGSSSNSNGHKWGAYGSTIESDFGNNKLLDTWTYVKGSASSPATTISYKSLDLAVSSITPNVSSVVVGNTITYTIVVTNPSSTGYTDNAVGASFGFTAPAGFNITSATAVQNSGTFSETSRSAVSGNTFTSVFNLTSNGQATYTITGTVGTTMAHTSAAATAYVMRPADYTDKDATSAIVGAPTNPQTECDGGTSGTGCNNIKTSSSTTISNSTPVAVNDAGSVNEDATLTVIVPGVKTNDTDADGDALTVASIRKGESEGNGTPGTLGTALAGNYGTINILADGSYTYIANNAQSLAAGATAHDYFNYTISDGNGGTDVAVIDITITGTNDAPVAVNDAGAVNENATLTVPANGVLGNDTDIDTGNTKTVTSVRTGNTEGSGTAGSVGVVLQGVYGTLTLYADGSYTYLANNASALAAGATAHDYFNYTMSDGTASDIAVIDITITGTNNAPVAVNDIASTAKNVAVSFSVVANDTDNDGTINASTVDLDPSTADIQTSYTVSGQGTYTVNTSGVVTFTPVSNFTGTTTPITYTVKNNSGAVSNTATITVTVLPDFDGDGIADNIDLDDDNDGITDVLESTSCISSEINWLHNADGGQTDAATYTPSGASVYYSGAANMLFGAGLDETTDNYTNTYFLRNATATTFAGAKADNDYAQVSFAPVQNMTLDSINFGYWTNNDTNVPDYYLGNYKLAVEYSTSSSFTSPVLLFSDVQVQNMILGGYLQIKNPLSNLILTTGNTYYFRIYLYDEQNTDATNRVRLDDIFFPGKIISTCDTDGDGQFNSNDLDSDGDGCFDAIEGDENVTSTQLTNGSISGAVDATGVPVLVNSGGTADIGSDQGQGIGNSQNSSVKDAACFSLSSTPDSGSGTQGVAFTIPNILTNDNLDDSAPVIGTALGTVSVSQSGTWPTDIMLNADGSVSVGSSATPGQHNVTYQVCVNGTSPALCSTSTVTIDINANPVANNDAGSVNEDATLSVTEANGVIKNATTGDTDAESNVLTVTTVRIGDAEGSGTEVSAGTALTGTYGQLTLNADGSYTYIANNAQALPAGATAHDYFNYTISDGNGGTDIAVIDITITGTNNTPVAVDNNYTTPKNTQITGNNIVTNDSDPDNDQLSVTGFSINGTSYSTGQTIEIYNGNKKAGTIIIYPNGDFVFTPENGHTGAVPVINYTITDGNLTASANINITIDNVNKVPVAVDDNNTTPEDTPASGNVVTNDTDGDNDILTVTQFEVQNKIYNAGETATILGIGTITIGSTGAYTFTPETNYNGVVPTITYTITDGVVTDKADLNITVTPVNDPPVAINDVNTTLIDTQVSGRVMTNDFDPENKPLTVTAITKATTGLGSVTIYADGTYTYTPLTGFTGEDTFTYQVCDNGTPALCVEATVTIEVMPLPTAYNDVPVAVNDAYQGSLNRTVTGSVTANDFDADNDVLTVVANANGKYDSNGDGIPDMQLPIGTPQTVGGVNAAGGPVTNAGSLKQNADGTFTFEPATGFVGQVTYSYVISDGKGGTDDASVTIDITRQGANTTNALNDVTTTNINTDVSGNVLSNDYDRQGNTMTVTNPGTYTTASGVLVIAANGTYTFTPATGFTGDYNFTYTMCDNGIPQACEDAILTITVMPLPTAGNDLPVALNNMYLGGVNTTITENVLNNDIDVDQNGLTVITVAGGMYDSDGDGTPDTELQIGSPTPVWGINTSNQPVLAGTLTQSANGLVTFVPVTNFVGQVIYSYVIKDGDNDTDAANVTLEIRGGNSTFATDDAYFGFVNMPVTGNMLANDYDPQGNTQTVNTTPVIAPLNGTVTINAIGTFTYTPKQDFMGPDYFVYRLCDNATMTACDTATVYINMLPEKVIAKDDINQTRQDIPVSGQLMTNDEGVTSITGATIGGESFTFGIAKQVAGVDRDGIPVANAGSLTINDDGTYTFTPATGFGGTVNPVTYTGTGANGGNDNAILSIEVLPELFPGYNPPVAQNDVMTTEAGVTVTSTVINNDSDPDGDPVTVTSASIALNSPIPVAGKDNYGNTVTNAGTVTLSADGTYIYQPAAGFTGTVNDITYTISDGKGGTDTAILSINVIGDYGNNTFANDDAKAAPQGVTMTGSVLANDNDPEGNTQEVVSVTIPAQTINGISVPETALTLDLATVIPNVGTITITEAGAYTFVPAAAFTGTLRVPYNVEDNGTTIASDQATLYLTSTPKTVIAENDIKQTPQDIPASGQLMTNDEGVTSITAATIGGESFTFGIAKQVAGVDRNGNTVTNAGSLTINGDGTYTFTPATGFVGTVNPVTYTGADVNGGNDIAILSIEVFPKIVSKTNPPVAQNDVNTTEAGATVTSTVINNDSDPDGDPLTVSSASIALGSAVQVAGKDTYGNTVTNAGTVTLSADGAYTYQPAAGFTGTVNDITYTISDGKGGTDTAILSINVIGDNGNNTFANDDAKAAPQGVTMTGSVLANDNDPEGNTQEVVSVTIPAQTINGISVPETVLTVGSATVIPNVGTITITEEGIYTFVPVASFTGTLRVPYNIEDNGTTVAGDEATLYLSSLETINLWKGSTDPTTGTLWNTASNWVDNRVPGTLEDIEFATEANNPTVPGAPSSGPAVNNLVVPVDESKIIGNLTNASTMNLIIPPGGTPTTETALTVAGVVSIKDPLTGLTSMDASKIQINAAPGRPNGTLILAGQPCNSTVMGTVQLYAKGFKDAETSWVDNIPGSPTLGTTFYGTYHWQHFGVPVVEVRADPTFYKSYLRKYHEDWNQKVTGTTPATTYYAKWENLVNGSMLKAFEGYEITQEFPTTYTIAGKMNYCDKTITLTRKAPLVHESPDDTNINNRYYGLGQNIFGNSYTASIDITKMNFNAEPQIEPTVYLYNTGRFTDWAINGDLNEAVNSGGLSAGQYTSIPKENAAAIYDGRIPSMNGFLLIHRGKPNTNGDRYTSATDPDVTMTLPYISELKPNTRPQTAPRKPLSYLRVGLASKSTRDNLWLFSQPGTTNKLDDGWDGRKFFGTPTAFIYTENADGPMQVSTNETIDGSVLSFYANSDTEYTLTLAKSNLEDYTDLHLIDLINRTATPLSSDTTRYHFTANSKGSTIRRFIIANSSNIDLTGDKFGLLHGYVKDNSRLIITNFTTEEGIVNLFDISGKRFINTKMPVSVSEIPVTLEPGVYILDLQADGKRESIKLIIK